MAVAVKSVVIVGETIVVDMAKPAALLLAFVSVMLK